MLTRQCLSLAHMCALFAVLMHVSKSSCSFANNFSLALSSLMPMTNLSLISLSVIVPKLHVDDSL